MTEGTNGNVSYTVKELIAKLDGKLDGLMLAIHTKADKSDVDVLSGRMNTLENLGSTHAQENAKLIKKNVDRIDALERGQASQNGVTTWLWRAAPIVVAIGAALIALRAAGV